MTPAGADRIRDGLYARSALHKHAQDAPRLAAQTGRVRGRERDGRMRARPWLLEGRRGREDGDRGEDGVRRDFGWGCEVALARTRSGRTQKLRGARGSPKVLTVHAVVPLAIGRPSQSPLTRPLASARDVPPLMPPKPTVLLTGASKCIHRPISLGRR